MFVVKVIVINVSKLQFILLVSFFWNKYCHHRRLRRPPRGRRNHIIIPPPSSSSITTSPSSPERHFQAGNMKRIYDTVNYFRPKLHLLAVNAVKWSLGAISVLFIKRSNWYVAQYSFLCMCITRSFYFIKIYYILNGLMQLLGCIIFKFQKRLLFAICVGKIRQWLVFPTGTSFFKIISHDCILTQDSTNLSGLILQNVLYLLHPPNSIFHIYLC